MPVLDGHLELVCAADDAGRSYLRRQSFRVPFHLSKTYWNDHALVAQIVNPTAGLFEGDSLRCDIDVEAGASLHVTTPSASRVHTMRKAGAELRQTFRVAAGGWLEYSPAPLIPQRDARYRQQTEIHVAEGGELFFAEIVAPGRVAHGECFQFSEISWEANLNWSGRLNVCERFRLRPGDASLQSLRWLHPASYYASCYVIAAGVAADAPCWGQIRNLCSASVQIGVSRLPLAGFSIKVLAQDSLVLQRALSTIRSSLSSFLPRLNSSSRRL